jgi:hypothetical protein
MMPSFWILLLISFLIGVLVREYLPGYAREKGKNLATREDIEEITRKIEAAKAEYSRELERVKADLHKTVFVHRVQFETEFKALSGVWKKLAAVRSTMSVLRPRLTIVDTREDPQQALQRRFDEYSEDVENLVRAVHDSSPFYPENIFRELLLILDCVNREQNDVLLTQGEPGHEWYTRGETNFRELISRVETISNLIRSRIAELTVIEGS